MVSKSNESTLRRAALDYLARREYSFYELNKKLYSKFPTFEVGIILDVVRALRAENLQSDERFVESYSRYRKSRGFGYKHIRHSLCQKKIENPSDELIYTLLTKFFSDKQLIIKKENNTNKNSVKMKGKYGRAS